MSYSTTCNDELLMMFLSNKKYEYVFLK